MHTVSHHCCGNNHIVKLSCFNLCEHIVIRSFGIDHKVCEKNAILGSTITCVKKRPKRCVKKCPKKWCEFFHCLFTRRKKSHRFFTRFFGHLSNTFQTHFFTPHFSHTIFSHTVYSHTIFSHHFSHTFAIHGFLWLPMYSLFYVSSWPAIRYALRFGATRDY